VSGKSIEKIIGNLKSVVEGDGEARKLKIA
jgi:hypothetical protein